MKKGIVLTDFHSGHLAGLTPPQWRSLQPKWNRLESELWDNYISMIHKHGPYDFGFFLGDLIDGTGSRTGGTELITSDRNKQVEIAEGCIEVVPFKKSAELIGVYGTGYHTGNDEDFELQIARDMKFKKISGQEWVDVNGVVFDLKHRVGSTTVPYSKGTAISKERIWNLLWTEHGEQPKADVLLRGHVHYFFFCGDADWIGIICPALQGQGSKFGSRHCVGHIDFGVVYLFVSDEGEFTWDYERKIIKSQKQKAIKI